MTFNANNLAFDYTASSNLYQISGTTGVAIAGLGTLQVTFGTASHPDGVVINNGSLASLGVIVNGNFTVNKVGFTATNLELDYTASPQTFQIIGTAGATIGNMGSLSVTFANQGVVITNGSLVSLDASITGGFSVDKVGFTATALELAYTASPQTIQITGTAGATIGGIGSLSVSFPNAGVVIASGSLVSLDASITGGFSVDKVGFTATNLELAYTASPQVIQITGTAGATIGGIGSLSVSFPNAGVVIASGSLVSLDASITGGFSVDKVGFTATALELAYTASPQVIQITGTAGATIGNIGNLSVSFPNAGVVIANGALQSLDASITGSFTIAKVAFTATDLELAYTASPQTIQITGTAVATIGNIGNLSVSFPNAGVVIASGSLQSLDASITGSFTIAKVAFTATDLELAYTASPQTYQITGTAGASVGGIGSLSVSFPNAGVVIANGAAQSIDVSVTSNFSVGKVGFTTNNLEFGYTVSTNVFFLKGSAGVTVGGIAGLTVGFGTTDPGILKSNPAAAYGIVITNGSLSNLAMYIGANFTVGGVEIYTKDLGFDYTPSTSTYEITGTAGINVGGITSQNNGVNAPGTNSLSITFGGPIDPAGILIQAGQLVSLDAEINASFWIDDLVQIKATNLEFAYESNYNKTGHSAFLMAGAVGAALPYNIGNVTVTFGSTTGDPGLVISNDKLVSFDATISAGITLPFIGLGLGNVSLTFAYTAANNEYTLTGSGSLTLDGIVTIGVALGRERHPGRGGRERQAAERGYHGDRRGEPRSPQGDVEHHRVVYCEHDNPRLRGQRHRGIEHHQPPVLGPDLLQSRRWIEFRRWRGLRRLDRHAEYP